MCKYLFSGMKKNYNFVYQRRQKVCIDEMHELLSDQFLVRGKTSVGFDQEKTER